MKDSWFQSLLRYEDRDRKSGRFALVASAFHSTLDKRWAVSRYAIVSVPVQHLWSTCFGFGLSQ